MANIGDADGLVVQKSYKNYSISPRANSDWWDIFKDNEFQKMAKDEEEARRVIWQETGKGEYITDEMMTHYIIIDGQRTPIAKGGDNEITCG